MPWPMPIPRVTVSPISVGPGRDGKRLAVRCALFAYNLAASWCLGTLAAALLLMLRLLLTGLRGLRATFAAAPTQQCGSALAAQPTGG
eukprot:scaffold126473_cov60-Phaeocystis_antarctica.AAC.1